MSIGPAHHADVITVQLSRAHCEALIRSTYSPLLDGNNEYSEGGKTDAELLGEARAALEVCFYDASVAKGRAPSIGYRVIDQNPGHTTLALFVGRTPGARGSAGQIIVRTDELEVLKSAGWDEIK